MFQVSQIVRFRVLLERGLQVRFQLEVRDLGRSGFCGHDLCSI